MPELSLLIDHHCHGVIRRDLDRTGFEQLLTEAGPVGSVSSLGGSLFDSQIGFAVRRWCAPLLDLEPHADPNAYIERRSELGHAEVTSRMLRAAGLEALCVDTGFEPEPLLSPQELGQAAGASSYEIVRLEQVAEQVAAQILWGDGGHGRKSGGAGGGGGEGGAGRGGVGDGDAGGVAGFVDEVRSRLAERARTAVGFKSIAAYRYGLELSGERPTDVEVASAVDRWLTKLDQQHRHETGVRETGVRETGMPATGTPATGIAVRVADQTLHRFLIWCGVDLGLPIQFHVGYGDSDVDLHRCDPLLLTRLLRAIEPTGVPIMLLHNYPFHRHAGYLAQVYSNVFIDVGLATHNLGHSSKTLIAEALELAPFGKVLYSSDAFALPELHYLGSLLFRRGLADFLHVGVEDDAWTVTDAERVTRMISAENARRVYGLGKRSTPVPAVPLK